MSPTPKIHRHPEAQHVISFGNRVFAEVINEDEAVVELWGGGVLEPMADVLIRREDT